MHDTAEPETDEQPAAVRALDELSPLPPPPLLRLAGDGDEDEGEQHICRGID